MLLSRCAVRKIYSYDRQKNVCHTNIIRFYFSLSIRGDIYETGITDII